MPRKRVLFKIKSSKVNRFQFGNCAIIAIAGAFKKKYEYVKSLYDFIDVDSSNGVTTKEIDKMVRFLCKEKSLHSKYHSNKNCISIKTFLENNRKGTFLISFDNHLACLRNGVFYDDFLGHMYLTRTDTNKVYGWWEIKPKAPIVSEYWMATATSYRYA